MSGTILLADDSLTIQKVVELTFADTDFRVVAVSSGDELLDRLRDSQPDLIICDVIMPGKDGYEVCQQIKSSSEWLHLPVILLTGTFEPFDRDRAIAAGCSEIITKPFEARKLVDTVERLIGGPDVQTPQDEDRPAATGDGEEWPEEATPVDAPTDPGPEDFGTQLSSPEPEEDGIEFTTSGFAEMEAAGGDPSDESVDGSEHDEGLDYEFGDSGIGDFDETTPSASPPPAPTDPSAQTVKIDVSSVSDDFLPDADQPVPDEAPEDAPDTPAADLAADEPEIRPEPEPFVALDEEPFEEAMEEAAEETPDEEGIKDEPSMADTSPVDPPEESTEDDATEVSDEAPVQLTEEDIDRIARRVIELASDRLEQIAWEIIPDMAEIVVRQRIRELEADSDTSAPDPVQ